MFYSRKIDFEELLTKIGGWGPFQWKLLGIFIYSTFILSYVNHSSILYNYTPDHWCKIPENLTNFPKLFDEETQTTSKCLMYDPDLQSQNLNLSVWPIVKCQFGYEYNLTGYFKSVPSQVSFNKILDSFFKVNISFSLIWYVRMLGSQILPSQCFRLALSSELYSLDGFQTILADTGL